MASTSVFLQVEMPAAGQPGDAVMHRVVVQHVGDAVVVRLVGRRQQQVDVDDHRLRPLLLEIVDADRDLQAEVADEDAAFHVTPFPCDRRRRRAAGRVRCSPLSTISVSPVKDGVCRMKRSARTRSSSRDADAQRIVGVLLGEARVGLAAAAQRQAGGDAGHPEPRREGLGQKLGQALQADLGQRVGEEIRIEVVELLVEQVHDQAGLAVGQLPRQGLRQQQRRAQVDGHVAVEIVGLGSGRAVELEQRGAVDQAGQLHARAHGTCRPAPRPAAPRRGRRAPPWPCRPRRRCPPRSGGPRRSSGYGGRTRNSRRPPAPSPMRGRPARPIR